ncbi:hypothetical protein TW81_02950 [Vibrio galatheae]|uniref:UPF0319 protein TW81_02950 n=1 Tax=Vibrio galatheae TaxID=579748 RepID=A0A0F4NMZ9_9VIBR|nr:DUF2057 family protein [Vibrio galatheae]KJY84502.1 hypothetical protein TW81_02950 [Vibrio galatheae]
MKIKTTLLAAIALGITGTAVAEVTIAIPDTIDVLVANDNKPELSGGLFSSTKTLTLPDGQNQILFTYNPYFDKGKERVLLESDPIIATFNQSNTGLEFGLPQYRNENDAAKKLPTLEWSLRTQNGQAIEVKQDKLLKSGMQIGRNHKLELAEYNRRGGVAAVSSVAVVPVTLPATLNDTPAKMQSGDNTAEEMLHFWYNKADSATQERFKAFINQK